MITIELVDDGAHPFLALPPFAEVIVKISHVVTRFVAVPVSSNTSLDVVGTGDVVGQFVFGIKSLQTGLTAQLIQQMINL